MLEYTHLKRNPRKFLALTGLTVKEFKALLPAFSEAYRNKYEGDKTLAKRKRQRQVGGGRIGQLKTAEQKLLFILVHQKTYPLQVVLGELFGLSQSSANDWIHRLLPILREALIALGVMPERDGRNLPKRNAASASRPITLLMALNGAAKGRKSLRNRHFTIVARKRCIRTRMWSSSTRGRSVSVT